MLNPSPETIENLLENSRENEQPDPPAADTSNLYKTTLQMLLKEPKILWQILIHQNKPKCVDGQQNKNTMKKTAREIAQVTNFLKLKNEYRTSSDILVILPISARTLVPLITLSENKYTPCRSGC